MADISKIKLSDITYSLKDEEARTAISKLETAVSSSLVFKGTISTADEMLSVWTNPDAKIGDSYKIITSFLDGFFGRVENGDMFICIGENELVSINNWTILQNNIDVFLGAEASSSGASGLVPAPTAGEQNKVLHGDGTWKNPVEWGRISDLI